MLGARVRSGRAIAVVLVGSVRAPELIDACDLELSDPAIPESKQPYHAGFGTLEEDAATIERRTAVVERAARRSVGELLERHRRAGRAVVAAGLVVGGQADPASIANPHIRAHALEGRLFRTVLETALGGHGVACRVLPERDLYARAAAALGRSEEEIRRAVAALGKGRPGPWRADQKLAATAAWMVLGGG